MKPITMKPITVKPIAALGRVTKRYGSVRALENVSFGLAAGEVVALIGHNGAGKTTLIKLILGLIRPSGGCVRVLGEDPAGRRGAAVRQQVGFLPENVAFHAAMTGLELLDFYAGLKGAPKATNREILARVGLADASRRRVGTYSKGMRQRLGLAQALIGEPRLLLLDEPTTGLDPASRLDFYETVGELRKEGTTVLVSTHALAEIEPHADRIAVMHGGRLVAYGTATELRNRAAMPILVRVRVRPCTTDRVLAELGGHPRFESPDARTLLLACEPAAKMPLLERLMQLRTWVEDVEIETPGLDRLYRDLGEEAKR